MSWDKIEYTEKAKCACGHGAVLRRMFREDDDWNRTRFGCISEEIECLDCSSKYHIEHHVRHYHCMPCDGDGISDRVFLVPNGIKIPEVKTEKIFSFTKFDEEIVSLFSIDDIAHIINDMQENKFSTKLKMQDSQKVVKIYHKKYKKRNLKAIVEILQQIIQNYDCYTWTKNKIKKYKEIERQNIIDNDKMIEQAIALSFELDFKR